MEETRTATNDPRSSPSRRVETTTCVLDCPDACALEITVERGPEGERIRSLGGAAGHATTAGFICSKVAQFHRRVDHPDRLLHPLRRSGPKGSGSFVRISWEEALAEVAGRLQEIRERWGGEAVLPYHYGGSNGLLEDELLDHCFFARLGASRLGKTICAAPTTAVGKEMYGKMPGVAYEDYAHARCVLLWGVNPKVSHIHLVPFLRQAKEAGAFIAVVDPLRNFSEREVDLHLPVYPGTDLPVALALIRWWKEQGFLDEAFLAEHALDAGPLLEAARAWSLETAAELARVPAADLELLARAYAESSPAVVRCGWGVERNRNGGAAVGAILAMPALLGKFGVRGGGYTMTNNGGARFGGAEALGRVRWQTRLFNMTRLSEALRPEGDPQMPGPPVKALFVYNCNPVATVPDQNGVLAGLAREDLFTVVAEQVMTDTAAWADVVLPATTFVEQREIRVGYGAYTVGGAKPVVAPRGEARSNSEIFAALGREMGWEDEAFHLSPEELFERAAGALEMEGHETVDAKALAEGKSLAYDFPGTTPIQLGTVHPRTADGKIHLTPPSLGKDPYQYRPLPSPYPLALLTPASHRLMNSTFGELVEDPLVVTLHPQDAEARGIESGDGVRVYNGLGEVHCPARVSDRCRPGVALMPKGAWRKHSQNGQTGNALCPTDTQQTGGGACFSDARVEVASLPPPSPSPSAAAPWRPFEGR